MKRWYGWITGIFLILLSLNGFVQETEATEEIVVNNPVYNEYTDSTTWDYVYFGSYPQSKVKSSKLSGDIIDADYNDNGDAVVNGTRYRRILVEKEYQYFEYEPIKWKVLQNKGGEFLLMSDLLLEGFDGDELFERFYCSSALRSKLNGYGPGENLERISYEKKDTNFIDMAFGEEERKALLVSFVYNNDLIAVPTTDIFCLEYGFGTSEYVDHAAYSRAFESTEYVSTLGKKNVEENLAYYYEPDTYFAVQLQNGDENLYSIDYKGYMEYLLPSAYMSTAIIIKIDSSSACWSKERPEFVVNTTDISNIDYDLEKQSYTYSGEKLQPEFELFDDNQPLYEGIDYIYEYKNCVNAGTASIEITGLNDYQGINSIEYTIHKAEQAISVASVITKPFKKNGFSIDVKRTKGNGALSYLVESDSIISVSANGTVIPKNVGEAIVTITAAETTNYKPMSVQTTVIITQSNIADGSIRLSKTSFVYNEEEQKPVVTVKYGDLQLKEGIDYMLTYCDNVNVGIGSVIVIGIGGYTGSVEKIFTIEPIKLKDVVLEEDSFEYDGNAKEPNVMVTDDIVLLKEGQDYIVSYRNNKKAGEGIVVVEGKGNYTGTVNKVFKILPKDITMVSLEKSSYLYNGYSRKPEVTVNAKDMTLKKGTEYIVTYRNNIKPGNAEVTVKGIGNYTGTITKNFTIIPEQVTNLKQKAELQPNQIKLSWDRTGGVHGYAIYRATSKNGSFKLIKMVTKNAYSNTGLKAGTKYYYKIRAFRNTDGKKLYGDYSDVKMMQTCPAAPGNLSVAKEKGKINLKWSKATGAHGYEIYMSTSRNGTYTRIKNVSAKVTSYKKGGLQKGKKYYFRVRAYKKDYAGKKIYSHYSNVKSIILN